MHLGERGYVRQSRPAAWKPRSLCPAFCALEMFIAQRLTSKHTNQTRRGWRPRALRWWNLIIAVLLCWLIIAILLTSLAISQRDSGIIFAERINDLPLRQSFLYLYLPTIIAVVFSIFIAWLDVDAKRFEPYHQMSKPGGALGKDSLLLHYPFEFVPIVPFLSLRKRHWLVFWSSLATVITTFAVVPLQAGIFSTKLVTRTSQETFSRSEKFMHSSVQASQLTLSYTQSVYGILSLNESTPAFQTLSYTLAPFTAPGVTTNYNGTWTVNTTLYSLDLRCEEARSQSQLYNNSASDCAIKLDRFNNYTIGDDLETNYGRLHPTMRVKKYSGFYSGWYDMQDNYYRTRVGYTALSTSLQSYCLRGKGNGTFAVAFVRNKEKKDDPKNNITALFCRPSYYEQSVQATVDAKTKSPLGYVPLSATRPLAPGLFNSTLFEQTLASGQRRVKQRENNMPVDVLPRYLERLSEMDLTPVMPYLYNMDLPPMLAMALSTTKQSLDELLDPMALARAYESAYRLLFARAMTDILKTDFAADTTTTTGQLEVQSQAVIVEPIFTYLVVVFLIVVSVSAISLLLIGARSNKDKTLLCDPGSIASVMSMVATNTELLTGFDELDCCADGYMQQKLHNKRYKLGDNDMGGSIVEIDEPDTLEEHPSKSPEISSESEKYNGLQIATPLRPTEFRSFTTFPVLLLFLVLMILLAALYVKSKAHGLPLPSQNRIVQGIVREYVPTAIATFIEPIWILINRKLCILQPLEELRTSRARASRSLTLNYNSLPPQLTISKAIRAGHVMLAIVCSMTLLANLLAVAFAGIFFQEMVPIARPTLLPAPFAARFQNINGSTGPPVDGILAKSTNLYSGAFHGGTGEDHFLVSESNYTRNTSLPFWVDERAMYLPFLSPEAAASSDSRQYQARTKFFSAQPNCKPLTFGQDYRLNLWDKKGGPYRSPDANFSISISDEEGHKVACYASSTRFTTALGPQSRMDLENFCRTGQTAAELVTTLDAGPNATIHQQETCAMAVAVGWMRTTQENCVVTANSSIVPTGFEEANAQNTFFMSCQPTVEIGDATILVNSAGLLLREAEDVAPDADQGALNKYFSNGAGNLTAQSNLFIFRTLASPWHNDSFASEHIHYLLNRASPSLHLSDPTAPLPSFPSVLAPMEKAYARLFAIWLGVNIDHLFIRSDAPTNPHLPGTVITLEDRIFLNTTLFTISQAILGTYMLVTALLYLRRPGRYLARMPTSIAAVIALFAASAAVEDMAGTSGYTDAEREKHLQEVGCRYGYGSFVGRDGSVHVGIEKVPFVQRARATTFEHSRAHVELLRRDKKKEDKGGVVLGGRELVVEAGEKR
ncbi:hypothetical protein DE146DRAFT_248746 [Phaeosphaeria sp. MPI-PUGE-AT-0046c]|nr:hypothetical protein DE146DRAFT_248746 [Phaeosphaeria sp. MPI-PUGE-AT-0046c]